MTKIPYIPCNLSQQFITEIYHDKCFIELNENYLIYSFSISAEEPKDESDPSLGLEIKKSDFMVTTMKKYISGLEISLTQSGKRWLVAILVTGFAVDLKMYYKRESDAKEMHNKIQEWLIK